jgi:hypothetical protein
MTPHAWTGLFLACLAGCGACSSQSAGPAATSPSGAPDAGAATDGGVSGPGDAGAGAGASGRPARYDVGTPALTDVYVSPTGDDAADGATPKTALRTLDAAWAKVPAQLDKGYRIALLPGSYPCGADEMSSCINHFEDRHGARERPLVLESVDASGKPSRGTATIRGGLDLARIQYVYLLGLKLVAGGAMPTNSSGNDVLHLAAGDHLLVRGVVAEGPPGRTDTTSNIQEVLKTNQVDDLYVEDSDLSGTFQTPVDVFSARHGHLLGNKVHGAGGRCVYLKGGSAYWVVAENEIYDCREAGVQAGEGSTLNLMTPPYLHHEAYDVKVVSNVIHDVKGPGLSVAGGYDVLFAYNTLVRVGQTEPDRQWGVMQAVYGGRSCVIVDEFPSAQAASAACQKFIDLGAWGTAKAGPLFETGGDWVPNANVFVYDNVVYNPKGSAAAYVFGVNGPLALPPDAKNFPSPTRADTGLVFEGNIVWNGGGAGDLLASTGGGPVGCDDAHPTCSQAKVLAKNTVNGPEPELVDPAHGDFRPKPGGNVATAKAAPIPAFAWSTWPAKSDVPKGTLSNDVSTTFDGQPRGATPHPGAY